MYNHPPLPNNLHLACGVWSCPYCQRCSKFECLEASLIRKHWHTSERHCQLCNSRIFTVPCSNASAVAGGKCQESEKKERATKYTALQACLVTTLTAMRIWKRLLVVGTTIWKVPRRFLFLFFVFSFCLCCCVFGTEAFVERARARGKFTLPPANCTHKHENVIPRGIVLASCLTLET